MKEFLFIATFEKLLCFHVAYKNREKKENFTSNDDGLITKNKLIKQVHITYEDIRKYANWKEWRIRLTY